ncbi:tRNA-dihydrouridine(20) synthase [NAD(P)+]-like [Geranomyces variabilis]|nr:tRNA-dihydrouridine(20) synthase [NAD(P)+]-like [Geranomyces variabilis]
MTAPTPPSAPQSDLTEPASRRMAKPTLDYRGKLILAPMVRVGTMPMRMLALKYGADLVYSPETVDKRLLKSKRVVNDVLGTIDFIEQTSNSLTLRMHPSELDRLVVQLGTGDPDLAVEAARVVAGDVAAIDLNCGCPKRFSLVSSMGAALLSDPDRLIAILTALKSEIPLPITCKIRLLPATETETVIERTAALMRRIEATGVSAIGVHCRFQNDRPSDPAHWDKLIPLARAVKIPVIANGDVFALDDARKLTEMSEINSFMLARAPQYNVSVFRTEGLLPILHVMQEYSRLAITYDMPFHNAKYCLLLMWPSSLGKEFRDSLSKTKSWEVMCQHLDLVDFYKDALAARQARIATLAAAAATASPSVLTPSPAQPEIPLAPQPQSELGPDCPYIPDAPDYETVMRA